jgi:hypothetical protein
MSARTLADAPVLVDLYCCAGGATKGYQRAGFTVIGVDIDPQPHYCGDLFVQMDALAFVDYLLAGGVNINGHWLSLDDVAAFHASPPCQKHSALTKGNKGRFPDLTVYEHPDFIPQTRDLLDDTGKPYVIENVEGAPIRRDLILCGDMFDLRVIRHRYFETGGGLTVPQPVHETDWIKHKGRVAGMRHGEWFEGPYFAVYGDGGGKGTVDQWRDAMGIDWIPRYIPVKEQRRLIAEAIPPSYAEYVGFHMMGHLKVQRAIEGAA